MSATKQVNLRMENRRWSDFEDVAEGSHMAPSKYASVWLTVLSELKPEYALDALGCIPKHYFRGRAAPQQAIPATSLDVRFPT
jgi:hypothetical protein